MAIVFVLMHWCSDDGILMNCHANARIGSIGVCFRFSKCIKNHSVYNTGLHEYWMQKLLSLILIFDAKWCILALIFDAKWCGNALIFDAKWCGNYNTKGGVRKCVAWDPKPVKVWVETVSILTRSLEKSKNITKKQKT